MKKNIYKIAGFLMIFCGVNASAQDKLGTKVVDIVKTYTPSIVQANKPTLSVNAQDIPSFSRQNVDYQIHSVPVASTFVPDKGKVLRLPINRNSSFENSYIALAGGSYGTIIADAFVTLPIDDDSYFATSLQHHNTLQNVENTQTDSRFSNTDLKALYRYSESDFSYGARVSLGHYWQNWYGVRQYIPLKDKLLHQRYMLAGLNGFFSMNDSFFNRVDFTADAILDDFKNAEYQLKATPSLHIFTENEPVFIDFDFDFLTGKFSFNDTKRNMQTIENQWFLAGVRPSYQFSISDFFAKISAGAYLLLSKEQSQFQFFPDVEISYLALGQNLIPYAGVSGGVEQNSYRKIVQINPYVSPNLEVKPSVIPFDFFGGIKGNLDEIFSYDTKVRISKIRNLMLFKSNPMGLIPNFDEGVLHKIPAYDFDNSFSVVYDNATAFAFEGSVKGSVSSKFDVGLNLKVQSYSTEKEAQAWNIPSVQTTIFAKYELLPKWWLGADIFYVGNRPDVVYDYSGSVADFPFHTTQIDGYLDTNFYTNYSFNRWTFSANFLNVFNRNYQRWNGYSSHGFQFLLGVQYQFSL